MLAVPVCFAFCECVLASIALVAGLHFRDVFAEIVAACGAAFVWGCSAGLFESGGGNLKWFAWICVGATCLCPIALFCHALIAYFQRNFYLVRSSEELDFLISDFTAEGMFLVRKQSETPTLKLLKKFAVYGEAKVYFDVPTRNGSDVLNAGTQP
jgi:hypothetical protein